MANQFEIYKCERCGTVIEVLFAGDGPLSCCGQAMKLMADKAVDGAKEKHVPVIEANEIATADGKRYKKFLKPGDAPEADFCIPADKVVSAREYCNLHGLWKA